MVIIFNPQILSKYIIIKRFVSLCFDNLALKNEFWKSKINFPESIEGLLLLIGNEKKCRKIKTSYNLKLKSF